MKKRFSVVATAVAALALTAGLAVPASAASAKYDGKDPKTYGCDASAKTVDSKSVKASDGTLLGTIELRYSTACRTVWAKVTSLQSVSSFGNGAEASIVRKDGTTLTYKCVSGKSCYTPMLDDKNTSSYAHGDITIWFKRGMQNTKSY